MSDSENVPSHGPPPTVRGYDRFEVTSAMQKSIRRGLVDDAMYWAAELDLSGMGAYCFKRLKIIASEDIGVAAHGLPGDLDALHRSWLDGKGNDRRLFLMHAVALAAMAPKSRMVVHSTIAHYETQEKRAIPDVALDRHTRRGKRMGRGWDHFWEEAQVLEHEAAIPDPNKQTAIEVTQGKHEAPPAVASWQMTLGSES